jgi:hypothetical protein
MIDRLNPIRFALKMNRNPTDHYFKVTSFFYREHFFVMQHPAVCVTCQVRAVWAFYNGLVSVLSPLLMVYFINAMIILITPDIKDVGNTVGKRGKQLNLEKK